MKKPLAVLAACILLSFSSEAGANRIDLLVPAYANPCCNDGPLVWTRLINAAADPTLDLEIHVIFNPASGPGTAVDPNYINPSTGQGPLNDLMNAGGLTYGYVATTFANKPIADVKAEIDKYFDTLYAGFVHHIFFDEMSNDLADVGYFQELRDYVRSKDPNARTIGNPGTSFTNNPSGQSVFTVDDYAQSMDVIATFENTGSAYENNYFVPAWESNYGAEHFAHIVHGQPVWDANLFALITARKVGLIYVTDDALPNPFDGAVSYWTNELNDLSNHNQTVLLVSAPDVTTGFDQALTVPVSIGETTGNNIVSAEVFVSYDSILLTALAPSTVGTMTAGWTIENNVEDGVGSTKTLKIAMADQNALLGSGTLINLEFQVADIRHPASSPLTLEHVLFNDGTPGNTAVSGSVTLVGIDGSIASAPATIIPREDITVTVTDADEDRDSNSPDSFDVAIANGTQTETLALVETGNSTGIFTATISTVFSLGAISGDGIIQAKAGDAIVSTYDDSLDAVGNTTPRSDQTDAIGGTDGAIRATIVSQPGDLVRIRVTDADLNADPGNPESVVVTAINNQTNESETLTLDEDGANSDVFFGTVATTLGTVAGTNDDGTFNTKKGDILDVTYDDVVTALGGTTSLIDDNEVVNPFGDADGNLAVQAFDAAKTLQHVLSPFLTGLDSLSANLDLLAFDPLLGKITPFDASLILQKRVGLIALFPVQEDEADNHPQPETDNSVPKRVSDERLLSLQLNEAYLSVWADERAAIVSGEIVVQGIEGPVQMGAELSDFLSASRKTDDGLRIVFAGASPASGPGELLRIYSGMGPDKVQLTRASFNDGRIAAQAQALASGHAAPAAFVLHANRPNPFNPETTIRFELPRASAVKLEVFDVLGQRVKTLVAEALPAGRHQVVWDGRNERGTAVGNGLYLYRIEAGNFAQMRRMMLLK